MQVIRNGLIISRLAEYWAEAVTGLIIVGALLLNIMESRRGGKAGEKA